MNYQVDLMDTETGHDVTEVVSNLPFIIKKNAPDRGPVGAYLIIVLCFATPVQILTSDGLQIARPGDCFIVSPTFSEYHTTAPGEDVGFVNDWAHLWVTNPSKFEELDVPLNTLVHTADPLFIRAELNMIREELLYRRDFYEEMVSGTVERMLIRIKRSHLEVENPRSSTLYHARLLELRQQVANSLDGDWSVPRMAQIMNLSPSRFTVVYREQFNASPQEDLILMRVTASKRFLASTNCSLREIAVRCGFGNEYYFSRVFKSKAGVAPSAYRRK